MSEPVAISLRVNGTNHGLTVEPRHTLADLLRHELGQTGTHVGCEHGICGACTVIVDDVPVRSCLMFGVQADDSSVETVEGLGGPEGELSAIQQAFADNHALQCGFCTPGFLMLTVAFLRGNPDPSEAEVTDLVASNLCRCTGYVPIVEAILDAAGRIRRAGEAGR